MELILDEAHITDPTSVEDIQLPDAPSLCEAMSGNECEQWLEAIHDEHNAIREVGTWTPVDHTPNIQNIVSCHFVLQKKCRGDGHITPFKARFVAQGFSQLKGINFLETFTPVVKLASLQVFFAVCTLQGWNAWQMDIKSAYLNMLITKGPNQRAVWVETSQQRMVCHIAQLPHQHWLLPHTC